MKFLFAVFVTLAVTSAVQLRLANPFAGVLRLPASVRQSTDSSPPQSARQELRLNFDECTTTVGCKPPRPCRQVERLKETKGGKNGKDGSNGGEGEDGDNMKTGGRIEDSPPGGKMMTCKPGYMCYCIPSSPPICDKNADCDQGESCVRPGMLVKGAFLCTSDRHIKRIQQEGGKLTIKTDPPVAPTESPEASASDNPTEPTESPTPTPDNEPTDIPSPDGGDDEAVCFPGSAIVHLAKGKTLRIDQLEAGHEALHDIMGGSSKIFLFTHRTKEHEGWFYRLETESGHTITLTGNHYIYADGRLTTADSVKRGNKLQTIDGDSPVSRIRRVRGRGLYAPHSLHGDLVIDGIVVSGYSRSVNPVLAHALLAPLRWLVRRTGVVEPLGGLFYGGGRGVERIIIKGADKY